MSISGSWLYSCNLKTINLLYIFFRIFDPFLVPDLPDDQPEEINEDIELEDEDEDDDDRYSDIAEDYNTVLSELRDVWLLTSITHRVSKTATNIFWELGKKFFTRVYAARAREGRTKRIPQFQHLRKQLYKDLPKVNIEIAYRSKASGEVITKNTTKTPKDQFPADEYQKLYEVATVNVSTLRPKKCLF